MALEKRTNSEYIRRDYNKIQQVRTQLNFKGEVTVPETNSEDGAVPLKQLNSVINTAKTEIIEQLSNSLTIEDLQKISFHYEGIQPRNDNGNLVSAVNNYPGIAGITFCTKSEEILTPIAWSWGETEFDDISGYNNFLSYIKGIKRIYYAVMPYENRVIAQQRRIKATPDEQDNQYLRSLDYPIVCVNCEAYNNYHFSSSQNYYDWSCPIMAFKPYAQKFLYSSGQDNIGMLTCSSVGVTTNYLDFWIETDEWDSLDNFVNNVVGVTYALCFSGVSNYGNPGLRVMMFKNNYKEMDVKLWPNSSQLLNARGPIFMNISEDEQYNNFSFSNSFLQKYGNTTNIAYLNSPMTGRVKYNSMDKNYTVEYM